LTTVVRHEQFAVGVAGLATPLTFEHMLFQVPADLVLAEAALILLASSFYHLELVGSCELTFQLSCQLALLESCMRVNIRNSPHNWKHKELNFSYLFTGIINTDVHLDDKATSLQVFP